MAGAAVACLQEYTQTRDAGFPSRSCCSAASPERSPRITPDVCYTGAGYVVGRPFAIPPHYGSSTDIERNSGRRWRRGSGTNPSVLRIFWGWNASKGWSAPEEPRWEFGSASALCKLYVVRETAGTVIDPETDPCNDFLSVFLPELDRLVFSTPL